MIHELLHIICRQRHIKETENRAFLFILKCMKSPKWQTFLRPLLVFSKSSDSNNMMVRRDENVEETSWHCTNELVLVWQKKNRFAAGLKRAYCCNSWIVLNKFLKWKWRENLHVGVYEIWQWHKIRSNFHC